MAAYENIVADYYIRSGAYVAALNRSKDALEKYNGVPSNEESLQIMLKAYQALGMTDLAYDTRSVLITNYGSSQERLNSSQDTFIGPQERELSENKQNDQPQKEVPKFWQRIKTLLPKTLNRNK